MSQHNSSLTSAEEQKRNELMINKPRAYEKIMKYKEKVENGESIAILQFQYDYTCNFKCEHCAILKFQEKNDKRSFTIDDVKELSRQADEMGLAHIVITGGEPLVFSDFDEIVKAIDPAKFYITSDTNGWFLDDEKALHLKSIGLDKIQLSIDSLDANEHDAFRNKPGSHERAMKAVDACLKAGLNIIISTVVTKDRIRSQEFKEFVEFFNEKGVGVFVTYAKPVGAWAGHFDMLIDKDDMEYMKEMEKTHNVFTHLTPSYGMDLGCIAVKRMVSITKYGDVMPCPYIHTSLGNFFEEPLKDIIEKGMNIKYFGEYESTCLAAEDRWFIENIIAKKLYADVLPVPYKEVFSDEDYIDKNKK